MYVQHKQCKYTGSPANELVNTKSYSELPHPLAKCTCIHIHCSTMVSMTTITSLYHLPGVSFITYLISDIMVNLFTFRYVYVHVSRIWLS